jgi:hypothetical protein
LAKLFCLNTRALGAGKDEEISQRISEGLPKPAPLPRSGIHLLDQGPIDELSLFRYKTYGDKNRDRID